MRPASIFLIIQLSNTRGLAARKHLALQAVLALQVHCSLIFKNKQLLYNEVNNNLDFDNGRY